MCYIRSIILLLFVIVIDFTHTSVPPITLLGNGEQLHCISVNDTNNSAITFVGKDLIDEPAVIEYGPPKNVCRGKDSNDPFKCLADNKSPHIKKFIQDSNLTGFAGYVLDQRWESFRLIKTFKDRHNFSEPIGIPDGNFEFVFSVRIEGNAHIHLCDGPYPPAAICYWFILDGWTRTRTALRRCERDVPISKDKLPDNCAMHVTEKNISGLTSLSDWRHFRIEVTGKKISLYKFEENDPIITYTDNSTFQIAYLTFRSPNNAGFWKIHQYHFMEVDGDMTLRTTSLQFPNSSLCVGLHLKLCMNCKASIELLDGRDHLLDSKNLERVNEGNWIEIHLKHQTASNGTLKITVIQAHRQKWYLGEMFQCADNGIRKVTTNYTIQDQCCYVIKSGKQICRTKELHLKSISVDNTLAQCPPKTIGKVEKGCIPCELFGSCDNYKYCEFETEKVITCQCPRGFTNTHCDKKCSDRRYGPNCAQTCNRCLSKCSHYDGRCLDGCKTNFYGDFCELFDKPVLKHKPEIVNIGYANVTLKLSGEYEGKAEPKSFKIQLKQSNGAWTDFKTEDFSSGKGKLVTINNLQTETLYYVKILLQTESDGEYDDDTFIPNSTFYTTCKELSRESIQVILHGSTVQFEIKDSNETCKKTNYQADHFSLPKARITLQTCSQKNVTIRNKKTKLSFKVPIKTGDMSTTVIQCPEVLRVNDTSAVLKWDYHGDESITYKIRYQKYRNIYCKKGNPETWTDISKEQTNVAIYGLDPYTHYKVEVIPTGKNTEKRAFNFTTMSSDALRKESTNINWTQNNRTLEVTAAMHDCTKVSGPIDFSLQLKCESVWCNREKPVKYNKPDFKGKIFKFNIIGLTNYTLLAIIKRNNSEETRADSKRLTTNATEPGPVIEPAIYSKTDNSMYLRWKPPYPPMGLLKHYHIQYHCAETNCNKNTSCNPKECLLYPEYHCCSIEELTKDKDCTIKICAINETPSKCGPTMDLHGKTKQDKPEAPTYFELIWEKYNNMTVKFPHPNITNGPLTRYVIYINDTKTANNSIDSEVPFYSATIGNIEPAQLVHVRVAVSNAAGQSSYVDKQTISPPPRPELLKVEITNLTIVIPYFKLPNEVTCSLLAYVIDKKTVGGVPAAEKESFERYKIDNHNHLAWIAINTTLEATNEDNWTIVIGTGEKTSTNDNRKLTSNTVHEIIIIITTTFRNISTTTRYTLPTTTEIEPYSGDANLYLLLLLIIPVICAICFFVLRQRGIQITKPFQYLLRNSERTLNQCSTELTPIVQQKTHRPMLVEDIPTIYQNTIEALEEDGQFSRVVKISELEEYIKNSLEIDEFERQHALFPRGQTKPWVQGMKPENKKKNRYNNLAAYDHTRVKLDVIGDDPDTDYINANYIDGYNQPKAFIATQGPKNSTLNDFWRMIWQENVEHIAMIANLVESGKKKVAKYWPDINETMKFGDISVQYQSVDIFADYEERVFTVFRNGHHSRKIKQLHFISWPDHGVPMYPQSLVPFHRRMLAIELSNKPIVVHCSAGVGRTGTVILCDTCLRMAAREGQVDILEQQFKLREQRPNMVDNVEQYKLVHMVLLQCLIAPNTSILCTENMMQQIQKLMASKEITKQMKYLDDSAWQDNAMLMARQSGTSVTASGKDRFRNILPDESSRIILTPYPIIDDTTTYINAITVDGFQAARKYVVSQYPLKNTVGDFWRMIHQLEITVVICLNTINAKDHTLGQFYPTEDCPEITPVPFLKVQFLSVDHTNHVDAFTFDLVEPKQNNLTTKVTLLQLNGWKFENILPDNTERLLTLYEEMNRIGKSCDEILICCYDGARASGLFAAMSFIIDRIKLEQLCDVCQAVRTVRYSRKEFVRAEEQFKYLYKCALDYVLKFELYSNFRS